jgi:multidrug efflux pump
MNISAPFIKRPVGTSLLTAALLLSGVLAFNFLPVAPLPQVEFPVIQVAASLPGASPETMASAVASPLERQFGRIAGINQMTSVSQLGSTGIVLQFDLNRNIDAAARDVQAAINAARSQLPADLPGNPWYRKVNPADAPILIMSLTSDTIPLPIIYDQANSILSQKLSQIPGVGQVYIGGGANPAVRVEVNPNTLNQSGIGLDAIRRSLATANVNSPKGELQSPLRSWTISANDQIKKAEQYRPLIVATNPRPLIVATNPRTGAVVRLSDVADVQDSVEDAHIYGLSNGKRAVIGIIWRQPGANIIQTVDNVLATLPQLQASISLAIKVAVVSDRTTTVRASLRDIEITLGISVVLVILVVFVFLRTVRATIIPSIAVPLSLIGTFGVMYLLGYSLDNLSLMALAISTGFVVDDAIVVLENITRHLEKGVAPVPAAFRGAEGIGFTVLSMSTSLIAVFIPILLMGGIVGRLFREFAVTLSIAIAVSLVVSLTTTPTMCAQMLKALHEEKHGRAYKASQKIFDGVQEGYRVSLGWVLRHQFAVLLVTIGTACLSIYLFKDAPKGFFPQQDTGRIQGSVQAAQDISFEAMSQKMREFVSIGMADPNVQNMIGFCGGTTAMNQGRMYITLKPLGQRKMPVDQVIAGLSRKFSVVPGATLYMQGQQDLHIGGRVSQAQYQYTLQGEDLAQLNEWAPQLLKKMRALPQLQQVNTDQEDKGLSLDVVIDRDTAARLGIGARDIDTVLYDAFGQRLVSTIYEPLNQYHVVMEVAPQYQRNPETLQNVFVRSSNGRMVPLAAFAHFGPSNTSLAVNHQGQWPAVTISFNLVPGVSLGQATEAIQEVERSIHFPETIHAPVSRALRQPFRILSPTNPS